MYQPLARRVRYLQPQAAQVNGAEQKRDSYPPTASSAQAIVSRVDATLKLTPGIQNGFQAIVSPEMVDGVDGGRRRCQLI